MVEPSLCSMVRFDAGTTLDLKWGAVTDHSGDESAPGPRSAETIFAVGTDVYMVGGRDTDNRSIDERPFEVLYKYSTKERRWEKIAITPPVRLDVEHGVSDYEVFATVDTSPYEKSGNAVCWVDVADKFYRWELSTLSFTPPKPPAIPKPGEKMPFYTGLGTQLKRTETSEGTPVHLFMHEDLLAYDFPEARWAPVRGVLGELPYDIHQQWWFRITGDVWVVMGMSSASVYLYHSSERKFACLYKGVEYKTLPGLTGGNCYLLENVLLWVNKPNGDWGRGPMNRAFILDLMKPDGWHKLPIRGTAPMHESRFSQVDVSSGHVFCFGLGADDSMAVHELCVNVRCSTVANGWRAFLIMRLEEYLVRFQPYVAPVHRFSSDALVLDTSLSCCQPSRVTYLASMASSVVTLFDRTGSPFDAAAIVEDTIPKETGRSGEPVVYHRNLMHYLTLCYDNHFGVKLTPDAVFYTLLCEIGEVIKADPEKFRHLFSDTQLGEGKKHISVLSLDPTALPVGALIKAVGEQSPVDLSPFVSDFSVSTPESILAMRAALLDAMGAYYTYGMTCCGIPLVHVTGTAEDWQKIEAKLGEWLRVFKNHTEMLEYLARATEAVHDIYTRRDTDHWKQFFYIDRCQSGHTDVACGWMVKLWRKCHVNKWKGNVKIQGDDYYNYKSHISVVPYKNEDDGKTFKCHTGLLYSLVEPSPIEAYPYLSCKFAHVTSEESEGGVSPEAYQAYLSSLAPEDSAFLKKMVPYYPAGTQLKFPSRKDRKAMVADTMVLRYEQARNAAKRADRIDMGLHGSSVKNDVSEGAALSPLIFDYWGNRVWTKDFADYNWARKERNKSTTLDPHTVRFADAMGGLVGLNRWTSFTLTNPLQPAIMSAIWNGLSFCTNLRELNLSRLELDHANTEEWAVPLATLLTNPACCLEELRIKCESFPPSVVAALRSTSAPLRTLQSSSDTTTFAEILRSERCPVRHVVGRVDSGKMSPLLQVLADRPDQLEQLQLEPMRIESLEDAACLGRYLANTTALFSLSFQDGANFATTAELVHTNAAAGVALAGCASLTSFALNGAGEEVSYLSGMPALEELCIGNYFHLPAITSALSKRESLPRSITFREKVKDASDAPKFIALLHSRPGVEQLNILRQHAWGADAVAALAEWVADPSCTLTSLKISEWGGYHPATDLTGLLRAIAVSPCLVDVHLENMGANWVEELAALLESKESPLHLVKISIKSTYQDGKVNSGTSKRLATAIARSSITVDVDSRWLHVNHGDEVPDEMRLF